MNTNRLWKFNKHNLHTKTHPKMLECDTLWYQYLDTDCFKCLQKLILVSKWALSHSSCLLVCLEELRLLCHFLSPSTSVFDWLWWGFGAQQEVNNSLFSEVWFRSAWASDWRLRTKTEEEREKSLRSENVMTHDKDVRRKTVACKMLILGFKEGETIPA